MRRYCKRKQRLQKRCFVKSQSDLPNFIRANRAQPVFETMFFLHYRRAMAALYYYFRLAYKHLLHGNKTMTCRLAYITAVFFLFFFGFASNAHCQCFNTSSIHASTLFVAILDISYNTLAQIDCVRHVNSLNKQLPDSVYRLAISILPSPIKGILIWLFRKYTQATMVFYMMNAF